MTGRPHDALFKAIFRNPIHAAEELRHALGPQISGLVDWGSLRLESGEFVDEALADSHSDLLFSARAGDKTALVYLLFDHQSTPDPRMALRLLGYMHRIWNHWSERETSLAPLPFILPVVLSHGARGWTPSRRFGDLFASRPAALRDAQPQFSFVVDDLASTSDEDLRTRALGALPKLALWLMRDARNPTALNESMDRWAPLLESVINARSGRAALLRLLRYITLVARDLRWPEFRAKIREFAPRVEEDVMTTIAEQLWAEGEARGEARGDAQRAAKAVLQVLDARGLIVSDDARDRIRACSDTEQLERWLIVAATASDASALFAE